MTTQTTPAELAKLKRSYAVGGIRGYWQERYQIAVSHNPAGTYDAARYSVRLGNVDQAFRWLEKSAERRDFDFVFFAADPVFESMVSDPRHIRLAERIR